jgi:hypothetical protein
MPPIMHARTHSQRQKRVCVCLKYFEVSITIVVGQTYVDIRLLVK